MYRENVDNIHIARMARLISPLEMRAQLPSSVEATRTVHQARRIIQDILDRRDKRLLVVVGPCSIHDEDAALEYARRLHEVARRIEDRVFVVMRTYFEKPRTAVGWKGLINDPRLDGSYDLAEGLYKARRILRTIADMGLATATEMLDTIVPQYIADLICWAAIGARTTESQTHREMASGLSMPVGFKNNTEGNLDNVINGILAARRPQHFLGINSEGQTCTVSTTGNRWCHVILRGGRGGPNYDAVAVGKVRALLEKHEIVPNIMVDCSHENSGKQPARQPAVFRNVLEQRAAGQDALIGAMLESHLFEGNQPLPANGSPLKYGVSITDACMGWEVTADLLELAHRTG